jgi:hypothetical protein
MLKVTVVEPGKKSEPVRAGQVRKSKGGYYGLVIIDEEGDFNVIEIAGDGRAINQFETVYEDFMPPFEIEEDFPIVVDAELTIKGA